MKKFICLSLALLSCISFANGQLQQEKTKTWLDKNKNHVASPMQSHLSSKYDLPVCVKKEHRFNPRTEIWNWDTIFTYDDKLGLIQRLTQTFDIQGNGLTQLTEQWQANAWVNSERGTFFYDTNGNMLTGLYEEWQTNSWVNSWKYTYTYDANGNMLNYLFALWQNNAWVNSSKYTYTYNANGNILTSLSEMWQANAWVNYSRNTYSYDANWNTLNFLVEKWQNNAWVNYFKYNYTYDANWNVLTLLTEEWQNNAWVNWARYTYTYDLTGNMLTSLFQLWQSNSWVNGIRETYTYDANGNSVTGKNEDWQSGNWNPGMGTLQLYSQKHSIFYFSLIYRYEASYSSFITGIANIGPNKSCLSVFPNPATEKITIERSEPITNMISSIIIYGMDGREMIRQQGQGSRSEINVSSLPNGSYFIRLISKERIEFGKFVKK